MKTEEMKYFNIEISENLENENANLHAPIDKLILKKLKVEQEKILVIV
jgi:hypothetical protein